MLKGVRNRDELKQLGLTNRMIARVGALLAKKLDFTPAALEVASSDEALGELVLSKGLLGAAADLTPGGFAGLLAEAGCAEDAGLSLQVSGDWRTVALEDELMAEEAFAQAAPAEASDGPAGEEPGSGEPGTTSALDRPVSKVKGGEALFSPEEIKRLKIIVATSAEEKKKIEAMRQLAYSPLSAQERGDIFIRSLSDDSSDARVVAAELLVGLGLEPDMAEAVRELSSDNEQEKLFAIGRIGKLIESGGDMEVGAGLVSLLSSLRQEASHSVRQRMLEVLRGTAPIIVASRERLAEVVRIVMGLLASDLKNLGRPVRLLMRALGRSAPEATEAELWDEFEKTPGESITALLLSEIASLPVCSDTDKLANALAAEIVRRGHESDFDYHQLGDRLMVLNDIGIAPLIDAFPRGSGAIKRYILMLVNDIVRYRDVKPESVEAAAVLLARCLETEASDLRVVALGSQITWQEEISPETLARLAEDFLENIGELAFPSDVEDAEYTVAKMGFPAVDALVKRLGVSYAAAERVRAARILGNLGTVAKASGEAGRHGVERVARELQKWGLGEFPDRGVLFVALAKLTTSCFADRELVRVVERSILERQNDPGVGLAKYEALGWLASSGHADGRRVRSVVSMFQDVLNTEPPEIEAELVETDDGNLFDVGEQADFYTEVVPEAIKGLRRIALGGRTSREMREVITNYLIHKWAAIVTGQTIWGPGNATGMVEALQALGCDSRTPVVTRVKIIRSLGKRISQLPVQSALGAIFAADDRSKRLAPLAASASLAMLKRADEYRELDDDDRQHYYTVLAQLAGRTELETADERTTGLRERLANSIFEGLRDRVPGCYDLLARLRDRETLPAEFREEVAGKLKSYEQIELFAEGG